MAISTSLAPINSFNRICPCYSPSSSLIPIKHNHRYLMRSYSSLNGPLLINCSSEMGSTSDPMTVRHPHISLVAPFRVNEIGMSSPSYKWQRVLLKVSGEALAGDHTQNIDRKITMVIAMEVASMTCLGIEVNLE